MIQYSATARPRPVPPVPTEERRRRAPQHIERCAATWSSIQMARVDIEWPSSARRRSSRVSPVAAASPDPRPDTRCAPGSSTGSAAAMATGSRTTGRAPRGGSAISPFVSDELQHVVEHLVDVDRVERTLGTREDHEVEEAAIRCASPRERSGLRSRGSSGRSCAGARISAYLADASEEEDALISCARGRRAERRSVRARARSPRAGSESAGRGASREGEESPMPGPDALCVTFAVYLPSVSTCRTARSARMYRPADDGSRRLRIRDVGTS